jgi:dihydrofolate reductase
MAGLTLDITMSLDGFVAGPNPSLDKPLGQDGERLHEWIVRLASWREYHGLEGGETGADDELAEEITASIGAHIMGRRMFSNGGGPWEQDPKADGWWGEDPPFHHPVFVLTHHPREQLTKCATTFTFVIEGMEAALASSTPCTSTSRLCCSAAVRGSSAIPAPSRSSSSPCARSSDATRASHVRPRGLTSNPLKRPADRAQMDEWVEA